MSTRIHPKNVHEKSPKKCPRDVTKSVHEKSPLLSSRSHLLCPRDVCHPYNTLCSPHAIPNYKSKFGDIVTRTRIQKAERTRENNSESKSKGHLDIFCDFNMVTSSYKLARNPFWLSNATTWGVGAQISYKPPQQLCGFFPKRSYKIFWVLMNKKFPSAALNPIVALNLPWLLKRPYRQILILSVFQLERT